MNKINNSDSKGKRLWKSLNNSEALTLYSPCHTDPSTLGKTLKRELSDYPILSQPSHITVYEQQRSANQKVTKKEKAAHAHQWPVLARWWEKANRSIMSTVLKLQHLTCSPRKSTPLTYLASNHKVWERFKKFRKYSSYKNNFKRNQGLPNWEWDWEIYIKQHLYLSIKQHLEFLCLL